jgi:hypothetical protein
MFYGRGVHQENHQSIFAYSGYHADFMTPLYCWRKRKYCISSSSMARGRFYFSVTSSKRFLVPGPQNFPKDVLQLRLAGEQPTNPFSLPFPWPFLTHQQQIPQHICIIIQGNIRITIQNKWPHNERMGDITKHQLPLRRCDSRTERGKREIPRKHKWWEHRTLKEMLPCPGGQTKWAKLPWSWQKSPTKLIRTKTKNTMLMRQRKKTKGLSKFL